MSSWPGGGRGIGLSTSPSQSLATRVADNRELTSRPLRPVNIQHHVNSLLDLENAIAIGRADWSYVDGHALPGGVEELVAVEQARDASLALARQQLQERCQVLGAHYFPRKNSMKKPHICHCRVRVIAFGLESHDRAGCSGSVNKVQRSAEQARQGIGEDQPFLVRPGSPPVSCMKTSAKRTVRTPRLSPPGATPKARRRCLPPWCHPTVGLPSSRHPTCPG